MSRTKLSVFINCGTQFDIGDLSSMSASTVTSPKSDEVLTNGSMKALLFSIHNASLQTQYRRPSLTFESCASFILLSEKQQFVYLISILKSRSTTVKRTPAKFLDSLKKIAPKLCRKMIKRYFNNKLCYKFKEFNVFKQDRVVLEAILSSEYWPDIDSKNINKKYKSLSFGCLGALFMIENKCFLDLYQEYIDHLFLDTTKHEVENFLGVVHIIPEEHQAFHYYFAEIVPRKSLEYFLNFN